MTSLSPPGGSHVPGRRSLGNKSKVGGIAVLILVGLYSFAAPRLNARFGLGLPEIAADSQGNVTLADSSSSSSVSTDRSPAAVDRDVEPRATPEASGKSPRSASRDVRVQDATDAPTPAQASRASTTPKSSSRVSPSAQQGDEASEDLRYGILREVSADRYISPAGLLYTPGSAEGHRLEHLRRHTKDDPGRPGSHGVFDGQMEGALKTVDQAYLRAKKGQRTTKKIDRSRTIYTVDMGRRVGYVGGRDGGRRRKPMARRVRLVLEGNRLITAYPL